MKNKAEALRKVYEAPTVCIREYAIQEMISLNTSQNDDNFDLEGEN